MCHLCNRELWNAINDADAVVTTGGHRITTLLQPDVIGHQTFSMAMVVLASKKLYLWSQTIGGFSFKKEINRRLVQTILEHSSKIYIRDEESANHVRALIGNSSKLYKTYDSVFGLKPCSAEPSGLLPSKRESIVGISVYTGISNREIDYHQYIESMAGLVKHVVTNGYRVKFFPMHLSDKREHNYFEEMVKRSGCKDSCEIVDASISTEKHLRELAGCRVFVGHKTHSIIFALTTDTPLVAIAYHVKTMDFMKQFELDEYSFMESEITPSKLIAVFDNVVSNLDNVYIAEQKKSKIMCEKVKEDFRRLIADLASQACLLAKA
jgi:polysaccharide pyruvyl transferase WcaK-like protein